MASWAAVLALTGFHYSGVEQRIAFTPADGPSLRRPDEGMAADLLVRTGMPGDAARKRPPEMG